MFKKKELTRLGDILVSKGLITSAQLDAAIAEQSRRKKLLDPADANAVVAPIGEILIELGFIDRLQLKRGLNWQQRPRRASIAMALCAPFMIFSPASLASTVRPAPITVEAENYSAMSGIFKEATTDVGGGLNASDINAGDSMTYNSIAIPVSGTYKITYRAASPASTGSFQLKSGTTLIDTVAVPATGGWQTWVDVTRTVTLTAGSHNLTLLATVGGFNVNWFKIESVDGTTVASSSASSVASSSVSSAPVSSAASSTAAAPSVAAGGFMIQAESYTTMSGVASETTTDVGGGKSVGDINTGDSMDYSNTKVKLPFTGKYKITYRVASPGVGTSLALNEASTGATINTVVIPKTGGWQTWTDVEAVVDLTEGEHAFTILAKVGGFNINWFKIEPVGTPMPLTIEAEKYSSMSGVLKETTTDVGGGQNVGDINTGDWMEYKSVEVLIPATTSYKVSYRVAASAAGSFNLYEAGGSAVFDTVPVPATGGWQKWVTVERTVVLPAGKHYFGMKALVGGFNINWIKIEQVNASGGTGGTSPTVSSSASSAPAGSTTSSTPTLSSSSSSAPAAVSSSSSSSTASTAEKVAGPVGVSWAAPTKRENGQYLDITDVGGYEIRYKKSGDTKYTYITINDAFQNRYDFSYLEGDYIFQIAAFDKNGTYSPFVNIKRI